MKNKTTIDTKRPQYHYFYGSIDEDLEGSSQRERTSAQATTSVATDQDSLVGESLIPTDNEEEATPRNGNQDLLQLLMTSEKGIYSINTNGSRRKPWFRRLTIENLRDSHPVIHVFLLIGSLSLFFFVLSVVLFPDSRAASAASTPEYELSFHVPFPRVDRAQYNDPISKFIRKDLFDPNLFYKGKNPMREFVFPFPTGAFWTNLVLDPTADQDLSYPIAVYPYAYKWSPSLLQVSYPARHRKTEPLAIHDYFFPDLTFTTSEVVASRYITSFDPLSVTLKFNIGDDRYFESYLVQGSPYVTINYKSVTPVIKAFSIFKNVLCPRSEDEQKLNLDNENRMLTYGVCYSADSNQNGQSTLVGVQFLLQTQEGMNWIVFTSEPITLIFDQETKTTVAADKKFSGVIRLAFVPPSTLPNVTANESIQIASSSGLQRLIYHAGVYPTSSDVSFSFRPDDSESAFALATKSISGGLGGSSSKEKSSTSSGTTSVNKRIGTIHFEFSSETFTQVSSATKSKPLLMLALPHHSQSLSSSLQLDRSKFDILYRTVKGPMRPILGSSWSYDEPLPFYGFDGDSGSNMTARAFLNPDVRSSIIKCLKEDIRLALPTRSENVYGFGKQVARLAQIAHIASKLQMGNVTYTIRNITSNEKEKISENADVNAVVVEATSLLYDSLEAFLTGNVSDSLLFDANLGGIVSSDGLFDKGADFGNGRYNDHHFQYGYILYACAIMGRLNSTFLTRHSQSVDAIYYDIAHNSNLDSKKTDGVFFPGARHKVWFDGHSFASGLFPFGNGKSQESSSEAVNSYYGAYLWSLVRNGAIDDPNSDSSSQTDFARLLLATELRGARTYW